MFYIINTYILRNRNFLGFARSDKRSVEVDKWKNIANLMNGIKIAGFILDRYVWLLTIPQFRLFSCSILLILQRYKGFFYFLFKIVFNLFLVDISKMLRKLTRSWKKCWNISHKLWILIWRSSNIQSLDILKPKGTVCVISNDFLCKDSNAGFTMVPFIWSIIWKKLSFF